MKTDSFDLCLDPNPLVDVQALNQEIMDRDEV